MIITFSVENFRSIADRQEIAFHASHYPTAKPPVLRSKTSKHGVVPVLTIFGANGAGKSNMMQAMGFVRGAIVYSQAVWPPSKPVRYDPHLFMEKEGSTFETVFELDSKIYRLGFTCLNGKFTGEWLFEGRKKWYRRTGNQFSFGQSFRGSKSIKAFVRDNSLFVSAAAQNNHPLLSKIYRWFQKWDDITHVRDSERAFTISLLQNKDEKAFLCKTLALLNPDIAGIELRTDDSNINQLNDNAFLKNLRAWDSVRIIHRSSTSGKMASLPISEESKGTQDYLALIGSIALILNGGGLLILDEAGASLHPMLLKAILALFQSTDTNPHGAQAIVSTHETTILTPDLLRPDEVWFADKRDEKSFYYSLADFSGIRSEARAQKLYLEGRFGAVPFLEDHRKLFTKWVKTGKAD